MYDDLVQQGSVGSTKVPISYVPHHLAHDLRHYSHANHVPYHQYVARGERGKFYMNISLVLFVLLNVLFLIQGKVNLEVMQKQILPVTLFFATSLVLSNKSYIYLSVSYIQVSDSVKRRLLVKYHSFNRFLIFLL